MPRMSYARSDIVELLLERRGITGEARDIFLKPDWSRDVHDPFQMPDMDRAVARILLAMEAGERIAIYADFDCDGVPGAALLLDTFRRLAYENVEAYIPHRDREGYGFHPIAIDTLKSRGVSLIITVDVGTVAHEGIAHAQKQGIDVIVTDHHEIHAGIPSCITINPKRAPYPYQELCGAGTAFKLVQALLVEGRRRGLERFTVITEGWEKWLLDLVAIATVADLVPLTGENRALVHFGLTVLRKSPRPGIRALVSQLRLRQAELTEEDISFSFAPRINAASRMDTPELALRLLTTESAEEAEELARTLEGLNASRKGVVAGIVREARKRVEARFTSDSRVAVVGDPEWKPSLLGLAANSILNDRSGVVCLWGRDAEGRIKGSCRSDGSVSVVELFTAARASLVEFGGHAASGGFSATHEHIHTLHEAFAEAAAVCMNREGVPVPAPDATLGLGEIDWGLHRAIGQLAPFGIGNPKPLFRIVARVAQHKPFGKEKNHVEVSLVNERGATCRGYQFFARLEDFTHQPQLHEDVAVIGTIERDNFRNTLALRVQDILPA